VCSPPLEKKWEDHAALGNRWNGMMRCRENLEELLLSSVNLEVPDTASTHSSPLSPNSRRSGKFFRLAQTLRISQSPARRAGSSCSLMAPNEVQGRLLNSRTSMIFLCVSCASMGEEPFTPGSAAIRCTRHLLQELVTRSDGKPMLLSWLTTNAFWFDQSAIHPGF